MQIQNFMPPALMAIVIGTAPLLVQAQTPSDTPAPVEIAEQEPNLGEESSTEQAPAQAEKAPLDLQRVSPAKDAGAEMSKGEALLKLGRYREAMIAFQSVCLASPKNIKAYERLRQAAVAAGEDAVVTETTAGLAKLYLELHNRDVASERLDELIALDSNHPDRAGLEKALGRVAGPVAKPTSFFDRFRSFIGMVVMLGLCVLMSSNRKKISMRLVFWGLGLQLIFGLFILQTTIGAGIFNTARVVINQILSYTDVGASLIFGAIYNGLQPGPSSGPVMYIDGTSGDPRALGMIFAFHVLPTIIFFGALMSVLYHLGIVQKIVAVVAWVMRKTMGTSGAESLSAAGNIFVGQTEAPLLIKPYLDKMTMSELMAVMCGGFATVAGGVLAAYVRFGLDAGHLLAASVMSAPAALVVAKILYPETEESVTKGGVSSELERPTSNILDAAAAGATDGLKLAFNVAAMLLAFMALIALFDGMVGWLASLVGLNLSLKIIFGYIFYPLSYCMGVDGADLHAFGNLLGTKVAVNEFVAYVELGAAKATMSPRSFTIATYALCGFANFSSIGIQLGGISSVAPDRRQDLAKIGIKAMIGGAIASWLTACIAGILI